MSMTPAGSRAGGAAVDLFWLPLGAGGSFVRFNGRIFELVRGAFARRRALDIYHAALEITVPGGRYVVEITPDSGLDPEGHGVIATAPVGSRFAGRLRMFRYEVHCWRDGEIPDRSEAVDSPQCLTTDGDHAQLMIELVNQVPMPVWGRDELGTGEMWTSNSVIAWLISRSGLPTSALHPPAGGCAPGWDAGLRVANESRPRF